MQSIVKWFTDQKIQIDKRIEAQYKLLDETNRAIAKILAHSQNIAVSYQKNIADEQLESKIKAYNAVQFGWEVDARGFWLKLRVYFNTEAIIKKWDAIKQQRDELDIAIYQLSINEMTP